MSNNLILLISRILLSVMFIKEGLTKFGGIEGVAGYIASAGLLAPTALAWMAATFETLVGAAILIGFQTRAAALLFAGFCVFTALVFHYQPGNEMQMINFMKNFALAGGFLALFVTGAGALSLDGRRSAAYA